VSEFKKEVSLRIRENAKNAELVESANRFIHAATAPKYCYNFSFLGRPIIQYPQDMVAMQELIWKTQPDLIIETGIAHGGSLIMSAAMLELNAACGGNPDAYVVGVDIDIRAHNRVEIEKHPMFKRIEMLEGSSTDQAIISQIHNMAEGKKSVLVCLDSMHSHEHVLEELKAYANLATIGNYCVVFDTIIEDLPDGLYPDRPWSVGNNAKTAVHAFLADHGNFEIDHEIENKLLITVCPDGFLKRVS
jgi:cephalosporin hydroxylase